MNAIKGVGVGILVLICILGLTWLIQGNDFFMYKFFGIKYENVRREIFEQSQAYNQGMKQELENMRIEYDKADDAHKDAIACIMLRRVSYFGEEKLPPDMREFVTQLKREGRGR